MTSTKTAADLIARSISHDEIVHTPYTKALHQDLLAECEDWDECDTQPGGDETEVQYWGTTEDGSTWRVHLTREAQ